MIIWSVVVVVGVVPGKFCYSTSAALEHRRTKSLVGDSQQVALAREKKKHFEEVTEGFKARYSRKARRLCSLRHQRASQGMPNLHQIPNFLRCSSCSCITGKRCTHKTLIQFHTMSSPLLALLDREREWERWKPTLVVQRKHSPDDGCVALSGLST